MDAWLITTCFGGCIMLGYPLLNIVAVVETDDTPGSDDLSPDECLFIGATIALFGAAGYCVSAFLFSSV